MVNEISKFCSFQSGLPHVSVSSCTIFSIYINDLIETLKIISGIKYILLVDAQVIWIHAPKENLTHTEEGLKKALHILSHWCIENNIIVNLEKTATQSFLLTHKSIRPDLKYRNNIVEETIVGSFDWQITNLETSHYIYMRMDGFQRVQMWLQPLAVATRDRTYFALIITCKAQWISLLPRLSYIITVVDY